MKPYERRPKKYVHDGETMQHDAATYLQFIEDEERLRTLRRRLGSILTIAVAGSCVSWLAFVGGSPLIVGALKTLYKVKPRWSIVTDDDERSILVLLTHEKEINMPSGLRGDDGNSYSYHSIERYFL